VAPVSLREPPDRRVVVVAPVNRNPPLEPRLPVHLVVRHHMGGLGEILEILAAEIVEISVQPPGAKTGRSRQHEAPVAGVLQETLLPLLISPIPVILALGDALALQIRPDPLDVVPAARRDEGKILGPLLRPERLQVEDALQVSGPLAARVVRQDELALVLRDARP